MPALLAIGAAAAGSAPYGVPLYLNGANAILFDHEHPSPAGRRSWVAYPELQTRTPPACAESSLIALHASLGAEIGDPFINTFAGVQRPNRDHETHITLSGHSPRLGLTAFGAYRYQDTYSDRYDSLWRQYEAGTGRPMEGLERGEMDGVAEERSAGLFWRGRLATAQGSVTRYARWGAAPLFCTPSRQSGWVTDHALRVSAGPVTGAVNVSLDRRDDYLDHRTPVPVTNVSGRAEVGLKAGARSAAALCAAYDDALVTPLRVTVKLQDSARGPFGGTLEAGADGEGRPWVEAGVQAILGRTGAVSVSYRSGERERPPDLTLWHLDTVVQCRGTPWRNTSAHAVCSLALPVRLAPSLSVWCDYDDSPGWFLVTRSDSAALTLEEVPGRGGPLVTAGGRALWRAQWRRVSADCGAQGHVVLDGGEEALGVPWNAWAGISVHSLKAPALAGSARLDAAGPVTSRWYEERVGALRTSRVPSRIELSAQATLPLELPFLRQRLRTALALAVDHVPLSGGNRLRHHPAGNLIGPRVQVALQGRLLQRR